MPCCVLCCLPASQAVLKRFRRVIAILVLAVEHQNGSFSLLRNKKLNWKPFSGRSQKNECYKRLIYKQFVQVSGLCGSQFLCYLLKRFTHLCRALYGDAILVHRFGAPMWLPEINKKTPDLEFTFSIKALSFHSRTSIRAHKCIL